jgi:hypothetical protein
MPNMPTNLPAYIYTVGILCNFFEDIAFQLSLHSVNNSLTDWTVQCTLLYIDKKKDTLLRWQKYKKILVVLLCCSQLWFKR